MNNKGSVIAIATIAILVIALVIVAIKFVAGLVSGAFDIILGAIVVIALIAIVIWMFIYAKAQQKK